MQEQCDYLLVDTEISSTGQERTRTNERDGKVNIKHVTGIGCESYTVRKHDGKHLQFSFFTLNGIWYVNINGQHVMDYYKFQKIARLSNEQDSVRITTVHFGDIVIPQCDVDIVYKSLQIMKEFINKKASWWNTMMYLVFH